MGADAAHPNPEVARRLEHIYTLHRTDIDFRLGGSPYAALLHKLGNPHKKLPPVVHVAGTNGKGSVIAFMRAVLESAGYRVHVYTSPHLITFNERIRLAGNLIDDTKLISLYDRVEAANAGAAITFFEYTTAMAFLAFAETPADIVLLEVGMGGRLDCTNMIEAPLATVITKISFDHMEFLGDTLPKIAAEKAGIMKAGVPCVIGPQMDPDAVLPVFENAAKKTGASLCILGKDALNSLPSGYPSPNLAGAHQIENAATALAAIHELEKRGFEVPDTAKGHGISHVEWPGRLQRITEGPISPLMPRGWELWFDAAHNDSGAMALASQLRTWKSTNPKRHIHLCVGMGADKDTNAFFDALEGLYDQLTFIDLPTSRKPQTAAQLAIKSGKQGHEAPTLREALQSLKTADSDEGIIIVAGSLYLYAQLYS
ncbi:MAG: bifunctional folylpolyglutamate synthase/dihydrofolate synthase [Proteobacteria bacterium]|nr:bifunctional folylpolyglutamate synthase/dihydrofolate synthase [Pseudomonadota bacterium]